MLRITCTHRPARRLIVEGNLVGLYVEELRAACAPLLEAGEPWAVDISGIGFADSRGVALLAELAGEGVELVGGSAFLRELLLRARSAGSNAASAGGAPLPTRRKRPDPELVAALRSGNTAAREELVRRFGPEMLATGMRLLGSRDEACLALREAFWAAFDGIGGFPEGARLAGWLRGLVVREALRRLAARRGPAERSFRSNLPRFTKSGERVLDEGDEYLGLESPGAHLDTLTPELRARVRACVDQLPDAYRAVLLLCDVEGFGLEEAASLLGLALVESKRRLHRSRQALRRLLGRSLGAARSSTPAGQRMPA